MKQRRRQTMHGSSGVAGVCLAVVVVVTATAWAQDAGLRSATGSVAGHRLVVLPQKGSGLYSWALPVTLAGLLQQAEVDTMPTEQLVAFLSQKRLVDLTRGLPDDWSKDAVQAAAEAGQVGKERGYVLVASWNTKEPQDKWGDGTQFWLEARLQKGDAVAFDTTRLPRSETEFYHLGDYNQAVRDLAEMVLATVSPVGSESARKSDVWAQRILLDQVRFLAEAERMVAAGNLEGARVKLGLAAAGATGQEGSILARLRLMEVNETVRLQDPKRAKQIGERGVDEAAEGREDKLAAWARLWNGDCYRLQEKWDLAAGKYFWWVQWLVDQKLLRAEEVFPAALREDLNARKPAVWTKLAGQSVAEAKWWATAALAVYRGASGELAAPLARRAEDCAGRGTDEKARADAFVFLADQAELRSDLVSEERLLLAALGLGERLKPESIECAAIHARLAWFYRFRATPGALARETVHRDVFIAPETDLDRAAHQSDLAVGLYERLAPDTLEFARALNVAGAVLKDQGDLNRALECYNRALALRERLAPGSIDCARSYNNIGNVYLDRGDLVRALEWHERARALYEKLEPGSMDCAGSYNNLGLICHKRGDLKAAMEWFEKAAAIEERLAPGSLECARAYANLADACADSGDDARASELHARAEAIRERLAPQSVQRPQTRGL